MYLCLEIPKFKVATLNVGAWAFQNMISQRIVQLWAM